VITGRPWTEGEDAVLRARYATDGAAGLVGVLSRSLRAISKRAERLGVRKYFKWNQELDDRLRLLWECHEIARIANMMSTTERKVYERGKFLGLPMGVPRGCEFIWDAAKRTGFHSTQIRAILKWSGIRPIVPKSRPRSKLWRSTCVDSFKLDEAIARWLSLESVRSAAGRRGVSVNSLWRRLKKAAASGADIPPQPGPGCTWRIPTETIDQVLSANPIR